NYEPGPYDVAIIGDYNIGGDAWSSRILLEEIGLRVVAQWSGEDAEPPTSTRWFNSQCLQRHCRMYAGIWIRRRFLYVHFER
ncbi:MAG: hypothetical protein HC836_36990, partial [Richelia sp. RM2_1_2]|nr:hypothetical protein [Richelia sp. RM2_1_2]